MEFDKSTQTWNDVGDEKARKRTNQLLRENPPTPSKKETAKKKRPNQKESSKANAQSGKKASAKKRKIVTSESSISSQEKDVKKVSAPQDQNEQSFSSLPMDNMEKISPIVGFQWEACPLPSLPARPKIIHGWDLPIPNKPKR